MLRHAFIHYITDVKMVILECKETKLGQRGVVSIATAAKEPGNTYKATVNRVIYGNKSDACFKNIAIFSSFADISTHTHERMSV